MTSTSFNVGIAEDNKLSSRVLRPPGGGHTDIFGGSEPEPVRGRRLPPNHPSVLAREKAAEDARPAENGQGPKPAPEAPVAPVVQEAAVREAPQEAAPKAPPKAPREAAPPADQGEAPKRVRVPPGGFSSGLW